MFLNLHSEVQIQPGDGLHGSPGVSIRQEWQQDLVESTDALGSLLDHLRNHPLQPQEHPSHNDLELIALQYVRLDN
jgi:hypothetical protein